MDNKNDVGMAILAKLKPKEEPDEPDETESMASEIMSAIKSGDAKALASALESFVSVCNSKEPEEPEEDAGD